jgi:threonine synthase
VCPIRPSSTQANPSSSLLCARCGTPSLNDRSWRCDSCGGPLDLETWSSPRAPWPSDGNGLTRFESWLPVSDLITLGEPTTALYEIPVPGVSQRVLLKLEAALPTGSFKDRGSAVVISWLRSRDFEHVVVDSSGNAGASLAAYGAKGGVRVDVFVPASSSPRKIAQIRAYGARVYPVEGSRADVADAALAAADEQRLYASHIWSPYFIAGTQTFAFEVLEQLGGVPDAVVMAIGAGSLLLGVNVGFASMQAAGLCDSTPQLFGVQADACAPVACAWESGSRQVATAELGDSIAEGLMIARPPRGEAVVRAVRESGGAIVQVDDATIAASVLWLASRGVYAEPTAAVAFAGLRTALKQSDLASDATIVVAVTGSGLKASETIEQLLGEKSR